MLLVSIISVNYKQPEATEDFLRSIKRFASDLAFEVIIVDNESEEDSADRFRAILPEVVYIREKKNLGFAGGNNLGIKRARGEYVLLLNNDTEITQGMIEHMSNVLREKQEVGMVSPLLLYYENKDLIQYAGYTKMNYITGRNTLLGHLEANKGQYANVSRETGYCHGAAMMVRYEDLHRVGLMDEDYFLYYEELDWCEKFKRAGLKCWFVGAAMIYHKESVSVGKESPLKTYFMARNRMLFIRKNCNWMVQVCFALFFVLVASSKQSIRFMFNKRMDLLKWHYKGLWWNITHTSKSSITGIKKIDNA